MYRSRKQQTAKHLDPKSLVFSLFTANEIRNLSVVKIRTPLSFNVLGHPLKGGLYDTLLGAILDGSDACGTCGGNAYKCSGHFGHIELPMPVVNPLFHKRLATLIKLACLKCFTLQIPMYTKILLAAKLKLLRQGFLSDIDDLEHEVTSIVQKNPTMGEAEREYIQDIIENYIQNLLNRSRFKQNDTQTEAHLNTKNINVQYQIYIDNVLKLYKTSKSCINCQQGIPKIFTMKNKILTTDAVSANSNDTSPQKMIYRLETVMLMPDQLKEYLRKLWSNEEEFLKLLLPCLSTLDIEFPTDVFFFEVIPVLPPTVRPVSFSKGLLVEHPQSQIYKNILQDCLILRNIIQTIQDGDTSQLPTEGKLVFEQIKGSSATEKLHNAWQTLQNNVDHLMDREMSKTSESINCLGLKQIIEKKEGIIRMHMMGKRVNYAARSVITPDPNLDIDEIGVPEAFALNLTYPTPVTPWNVRELRKMVLNGPAVHPGAVMIEHENGSVQVLTNANVYQREAIAKHLLPISDKANTFFTGVKTVYRHLQNGDILLVNRQPTLHKPSIMAHKARVLKGEKTLRLHYANCKAYNADFDGDEMNVHFPQNELARSEGQFIANVSNQYLVPKDGTPLSGLIQDHVISGARLTLRGNFFSKEDYMQLVYSALSAMQRKLKVLPPAIIKPIPLWSGKQIVSTVIINIIPPNQALINLSASAKINAKAWEIHKSRAWKCGVEFVDPKTMSEAEVIVRNGELLCGVLDKNHYGATPYGLIHCVYELYGGICSSNMLSAFGKLFQAFLQRQGFTLGIADILLLSGADRKRKEVVSACRQIGKDIQKLVLELPDDTSLDTVRLKMEESYWNDPKFCAQVDRKYKSALDVYTNNINKVCLPRGLIKKFPDNNLQFMVQSGAKGSTVNTMQISCLLGQIELEGKRPPLMISGKSLPSFPAYDATPRSGGFIDGRFMTGIQPQEFFFHCMAGREGLIDTAVKTSRSGYLQRCLIKHLEGLVINYDATVRDFDGSLVQSYYGEDGLDVLGAQFLKSEQINFLIDNRNAIKDEKLIDYFKKVSQTKAILKLGKKIKKWKTKNGNCSKKRRANEFVTFSAENAHLCSSKNNNIDSNSGRSKAALSLMRKWLRADEQIKKSLSAKCLQCPDPVMSRYRQDIEFGVLSERLENMIDEYVLNRSKMNASLQISKNELRDLLSIKIIKTVCPPGESVGLLAAQSIGEPSTQMTLNTFHFAGRGEMNVTLGIPRLREILMMATRNIKTPSMEIPFRKDLKDIVKVSNQLKVKLTKCIFSDILKTITISRKLEHSPTRQLIHTMDIKYLPHKYYKGEFDVKPKDVLKQTEEQFFKAFFKKLKLVAKINDTLLHLREEKRQVQDDIMLDQEEPEGREELKSKSLSDLGEMHESSDEEVAAEDADATITRTMSRHEENQEYEDPEDEELEIINEKDDEIIVEDTNENIEDEAAEDDNNDSTLTEKNCVSNEKRKRDVVNMYTYALDYDYDDTKHLWSKLTFVLPVTMTKVDLPMIIRDVANKIILWETPCIKRAFTFQNANKDLILKTDGLNIVEMFKYEDIIDINKLYSNDIYGISQTYGIEAAYSVIIKEVKDVFRMYGINVDFRHLSLIADYMTFDGIYQPLSRKGMEDSSSPLQQMSFESSLNFLRNATLQGKQDDLVSPSSRLMLGQPCKSGTGICSLLIKMQNQSNLTSSFVDA